MSSHQLFPLKMSILKISNTATPKSNPCVPSPCGPNSQCKNVGGQGICSCLPNYEGLPPNCKAECMINSGCPPNKACHNQKCIDPCPGSCGSRARCSTVNHSPRCECPPGMTGDPSRACYEDSKIFLDKH